MKFVMLIAFFAVLAQASQVCGDEQATKQDATDALAEKIDAKLNSRSTMVATAAGEISSQKDTIVRKIDRSLLNLQAVKVDSVGKGRFKACMLKTDAAKPYLISLRNLSAKLVNLGKKINQDSCNDMRETYADIENVEKVLAPLGQMDYALEKEYKPAYAKAKEECSKVGKGVYIESDNKELKRKIGFQFTNGGCLVAENKEAAAIILSMSYEEREKKNSRPNTFTCEVSVEISLRNIRTGKSPYENIVSSTGIWTNSFEDACKEDAMLHIPNKIWEEIKGKFNKGECK
jgi:phage gpG-like protein